MRHKTVLASLAAGIILIGASALPASPKLIWNRTESVPLGLYIVVAKHRPERGDLIVYSPTDEERHWLEARGYTGRNWPLMKRSSAIEGDTICREDLSILVNGRQVAEALRTDQLGRNLPVWTGCFLLRPDEVFLLADHPKSLDGRYFGVQKVIRISGIAHPIWTIRDKESLHPTDVSRTASSSWKATKARRARLRGCHLTGPDQRSAHLFACDSGPEEQVTQCSDTGCSDD